MGMGRRIIPFPLLLLLHFLSFTTPQSTPTALDALLQDYAFRAFVNPRTGIPYHAPVPSNFPGIHISAIRLRSGSLRARGLTSYNHFTIPVGLVERPYVQRLVLVYHNLANWSSLYYHLPGYTHLTPVLGLLAYDASNLSAKNLPHLDIKAQADRPILINFAQIINPLPQGSTARCVWFDLDGFTQFTNVSSGNVCSTLEQGHFSIVIESTAPAPAPTPSPLLPPITPPPTAEGPPTNPKSGGGEDDNRNTKVWIIVGSVLGGLLLFALLGLLLAWVRRYKRKNKMHRMERAAEVGESLNMTSVGNTRAPVAMVTRTQPTIENEYVP